MVKIAFWDNCLGERGTSVSLYDYAHFNETILGNTSIILYNVTHPSNNQSVIENFKSRFDVFVVSDWSEVDPILKDTGCDILYVIKAGNNEGQVSKVCKTCVHCVFTAYEPHGDVYAPISYWIYGNEDGKYPVVPHMVYLPDSAEDMRKELDIPENAVVFGRYGGFHQFDIPYVQKAVYDVALENPNIFFVFANTQPFCPPLKNIKHLETIVDLKEKAKFINTCDAMLWGRSDGESFGLSIAEFSIKNKPVLATHSGYAAHVHLLKDKAIWYSESTLKNILTTFDVENARKQDWNAYTEYSPEKVMAIFKKVFID